MKLLATITTTFLSVIFVSNAIASNSNAQCEYKQIEIPDGVYSLESFSPNSEQFIQVSTLFSEDGGRLLKIMGIEFKDSSMTTEKLKTLNQEQVYDTAAEKTNIYSGNASISSRQDASGYYNVICKGSPASWGAPNFDGYRVWSNGEKVGLGLARTKSEALYSLIIRDGLAVPVSSK